MNNSPGPSSIATIIPFAVVLFDSLFAYFARPLGIMITANAIVPLLLLIIGLYRFEWMRMQTITFVWLAVLVVALSMAVVTVPSVGAYRILEACSCAASFWAGHLMWKNAKDVNQIARWLLVPSLIYVVVCLVALSGVDPVHFPVTTIYWSQEGIAQPRPRVTADANMQIYYLFPAALSLALPFKLLRLGVAIPAVVGGLYVLAQLQTRSGVIVYCFVLLLTLLAPIYLPNLGRAKVLLYPVAAAAIAAAFWPLLIRATELLVYRFGQDDVADANGRVESTLYAFQILFDPRWWIPQGADEFMKHHGGLPHSNLAGIYLDGGLLGLAAWVALTVIPVARGGLMFIQRQLDAAAAMAFIAAAAVLVIQLSLHNPTHDHVWLWAGALTGALTRVTAEKSSSQSAPRAKTDIGSSLNQLTGGSTRFPNLLT